MEGWGCRVADKADKPGQGGGDAQATSLSWREHWQLPAMLLGVMVLVAGVMTAVLSKPKPKVGGYLEEAAKLIEAEKYEPALQMLNTKVKQHYQAGHLQEEQVREFHILRGRALFLAEKAKGIDLKENAANIVEEYAQAAQHGAHAELGVWDRYYLAEANVTLEKYVQAIDLAHSLPPEARENRGRVIKRVVEGLLGASEFDSETTPRLLGEFLQERELSVGDRGWALARQAELLMRQGLMTSAVTKILQTLPALMNELDRDQLGELYLLLGKAYFESDALTESARQLQLATAMLLPTDPRHAQAMVLLGRIDEQIGDPPEEGRAQAKAKYTEVAERFAHTPTRLPALLGLGEVNAAQGDIPSSLEAYAQLVGEIVAGKDKGHSDVSADAVTRSLMACVGKQFDAGQLDRALDFAALAEKLHPVDAVPPEVLASIARAHRAAAERLVSGNEGGESARGGTDRLLDLARLDPATREQARQHLVAAGRYFKRHADRIGISDNAGFGRSLWMAADCYDQAGDSELAIPLFTDYTKFFKSERQQPEARFRLAQAHQARGDYSTAADLYRALIEDGSQPGSNAGPYGDASHVPLAQCYIVDGDPANDAKAEELLERVVQGQAGGPDSSQFKDALRELGRMRFAKGDFAGAIGLLHEAATRFPEGTAVDGVRFELAEALRQDARAILKTLGEAMPDARRQALTEARKERLSRAAGLYDDVRKALEAKDPKRLSRLEQLELRNSCFFIADCEFDLGNYETAIRHYDAAREKYSGDPASLVAMVQIVNAYVEQGDMKRAATAQERARRFYDSLPVAVWQDPNLPMTQDHWKLWLQSMNSLKPIKETGAASAAAGTTPPAGEGH